MEEKIHNNTRTALLLLLVLMCVIMGALAGDFLYRTKAYKFVRDSKDDWRYGYYDGGYDFDDNEEDDEAFSIISDLCDIAFMAGFPIMLLLIVTITLFFSARRSYGPKHSNKMALALVFFIFIPITLGILEYTNNQDLMGEIIGLIPATGIALFLLIAFLITYELGGRKYGAIGLILGILAVIPLSTFSFYESDDNMGHGLKLYCIYFMIADVGLFIALSFYIASIKRALDFSKKHPASPEKPYIPPVKPKLSIGIRFRNIFKNRKAIATTLVLILLLSGFGVYWFVIRTPSLEEFLQDSYSDGEKAKFKDKVMDVEVRETSYGTVTLIYFEDYYKPFCFMGDRSSKYQVGKTAVVELEFHRYNIDGIQYVFPEELLLGKYLLSEMYVRDSSFYGGIVFQPEPAGNRTDGIELEISSLRYGSKTYSLDYYETAYNRFHPLKDNYRIAMGEYPYDPYDDYFEDMEPGSLLYNFEKQDQKESSVRWTLFDSYNNCSIQKTLDSYLPDDYSYIDEDNDGNLSIGDRIEIKMEATVNKYTINNYFFGLAGITSGSYSIMNWYKGPFYLHDNKPHYIQANIERTPNNGSTSYKVIVEDIDIPSDTSELSINFYFKNVSGYDVPLADGILAKFGTGNNIPTVSYSDDNKNGLLDTGDYFRFDNLENDTRYSISIREATWDSIFNFVTIPSLGWESGNYPIVTMEEPLRINGNISINVSGVQTYFQRIGSLKFNINISGEIKTVFMNDHDETSKIYSSDSAIITVKDSDDNECLTPNDIVRINGLEPGTEFSFQIWSNWYDDRLLYEWSGKL